MARCLSALLLSILVLDGNEAFLAVPHNLEVGIIGGAVHGFANLQGKKQVIMIVHQYKIILTELLHRPA